MALAEDKKRTAPSFKTRDLKGKIITTEKLYSQGASVVFFWHSCCGLNKDQLKILKELYSRYKEKGFEIIGIALDGASKTAKVKKAVTVNKMPWFNVVDKNNAIKDKFNPTAVPSLFIIDKSGKVVGIFNGYETGDDKKISASVTSIFEG
jgi:glutathione peroxidase-family protein